MPLSAVAVTKAKPREKAYKLTDERGLYLLVSPKGGRSWRMNYRFADKFRTIAFGVFPDVSLADARARRDDARKLLAKGIDPTEERKEEEARIEFEATTSFEAVAEEWLAKREREGLGEITIAKAKCCPAMQARALDLGGRGAAGRAIGRDQRRLARAP